MKKIILNFSLAFISLIFIYSCGSSNVESKAVSTIENISPEAYLEQIVSIQTSVGESIINLNEVSDSGNKDEILKTYNELVTTVTDANSEIKKLECYDKNDCELRDAAQNLFNFYEEMIKIEYKEIVDFMLKDSDQITNEDVAKLQEIATNLSQKEVKLDTDFNSAQKSFASKHNFTLTKNKLQDEIDNL